MIDNRGTKIEVGQTCCFNYMGQIALGKIQKITKGTRHRRPFYIFHVLREHPRSWSYQISKVTNPKNLMVIFESSANDKNISNIAEESKLMEWLKK
jgi:hypothetical protein